MKKWRKWQHEVRRVAEVLGAPFIGREMEGRGREAGDQAAAGGAPLTASYVKRRQRGGHLMRGKRRGDDGVLVPWHKGWHGYSMRW
jgi:hypothetical protein